jgi:fimbrial chaperone protein
LSTRKILRFPLALLLAASLSAPAWAGLFSVTPVRIFMSPRDRATAITVTNEGDEELVMQADVYTWKQKPSGEDDLVLSEDLILSPPILKLAPRSRQVVRLAMIRPPKGDAQLTYRMIVREVPEANAANKDVQLQVALAFSLPVFITPPGVKRRMECAAQREAPDAVSVTCENIGNAYVQPREFAIANAAGDKLASRDSGLYLLPGIKRTFDLKSGGAPIPGGKLRLAVTHDDGSAQNYDVTVSE